MPAVPEPRKLTAEEYYKVTETMTEHTELIDGEIVMLAQPSILHQQIAGRLYSIADQFIRSSKGACTALQAVDVRLTDDVSVVPDVMVVCDPTRMDEKRCYGAPDWVIEVTSTNRDNDFDRKLRLYRQHGVREYWIIDTDNRVVWVYHFEQHPNVVEFHDWADSIPVGIYEGKLTICVADLL